MDKENSKNSKKSRRKRSGKRKLPIVLAAVAATIAVALVVLFFAPFFSINTISSEAFEHYSAEKIESYLEEYIGVNGFRAVLKNSSLRQSKSFFSMELVDAEEKIMFDCPYLENVCVKYVPGRTLSVTADERRPSFMTEYYDTYLLCDTHGIVLETFTKENVPEGMPLVKGISLSGYKLGRSISDGKNKNIDTAIRVCGLMSQLEIDGYIDIADVSDYNNIYLYCAPSLTVKIGGPEDMGVKLSLLKGVFDKGLNGESNGLLTVADGKQATFIKNGERED
ncbi:MAG: hypothetical protein J5950_04515 [Clostridia bacterium]|nr:hypothetical protein [Clostridia bacterium]